MDFIVYYVFVKTEINYLKSVSSITIFDLYVPVIFANVH